jgi:hypothetical protein
MTFGMVITSVILFGGGRGGEQIVTSWPKKIQNNPKF